MQIAIEGCAHGELEIIYESVLAMEEQNGKIDLLLLCGDVQTPRNEADMCCMAMPPKYRDMKTFYKYDLILSEYTLY